MHDFKNLAYLDLHKTGSSYVSAFLNACCTCPEVRFSKHDWVREDYNPDCFYFITIRNVISLYSSLYRYGLDGRGDVHSRLKRRKKLSVYNSFDTFVAFCLDAANGDDLGFGFTCEISRSIGFMSFRFLKLSLQFPMNRIQAALAQGEDLTLLERDFITSLEIKNEALSEGLLDLSTHRLPHYFDQAKVTAFLATQARVNVAQTPSGDIDLTLSPQTQDLLNEKERLLISRYTG